MIGPFGGSKCQSIRTSARAGLEGITRVPLGLGNEDHQVSCDWIGRGGADLSMRRIGWVFAAQTHVLHPWL